jgi:hypothetical protein
MSHSLGHRDGAFGVLKIIEAAVCKIPAAKRTQNPAFQCPMSVVVPDTEGFPVEALGP